MINGKIRGDILESEHKHIVFAVNIEGFNDAGFAGLVSKRYWPALAMTGPAKLGAVMRHESNGKIFHAIVCHSLKTGWGGAPQAIEEGINGIAAGPKETIGAVAMGSGMIGRMQGADVEANLQAMEKAKHKVTVYSL